MLSAYDVSGLKRGLADITADEGTFVKYVSVFFNQKYKARTTLHHNYLLIYTFLKISG